LGDFVKEIVQFGLEEGMLYEGGIKKVWFWRLLEVFEWRSRWVS